VKTDVVRPPRESATESTEEGERRSQLSGGLLGMKLEDRCSQTSNGSQRWSQLRKKSDVVNSG